MTTAVRDKHNIWDIPWSWAPDEIEFAWTFWESLRYERKRHAFRGQLLRDIAKLMSEVQQTKTAIAVRHQWVRNNQDFRTVVKYTAELPALERQLDAWQKKLDRARKLL